MPGKVKVRVVAGRGLPVMDRSADTPDAFAEVLIVVWRRYSQSQSHLSAN